MNGQFYLSALGCLTSACPPLWVHTDREQCLATCYGLDFECHPKPPPPMLKDFLTSLRHYWKVGEPGGGEGEKGQGGAVSILVVGN